MWSGRDIDPKWGYIRPFDRVIRQQLIDNLQATHGIDLQTFTSQGDLITCDAFVTHKDLQAAHQVLVESFDFVDESELTTERERIGNCRSIYYDANTLSAATLKSPKSLWTTSMQSFLNG
jgi:hypothetical protein